MQPIPEPKIFISYRRSDAGGHAGRLFDRLTHWFDKSILFYDLDGIDSGDTFPDHIEAALNSAAVVLVAIGPNWLDEINQRVGKHSVDFVRREVELALARHAKNELCVLPVLMGNISMPSAHLFHADLQTCLGPLCAINAHTFQGNQSDWDEQFVRLRTRISHVPGVPSPRFRAPSGIEQPFRVIEHSLSTHFHDPNDQLSSLRDTLLAKGKAALHGMGGAGKTQLTLKYSHEYRDHYSGVWWFRAETETTLQLDAKHLCAEVNATIRDSELPSTALIRWLAQQTTPWLLAYDNAEEMTTLRAHLPDGECHHVLITSRSPAWSGLAQPMTLGVWTSEQGADFLNTRLQNQTRDELIGIAQDLGGLPLALEQAASYIEVTGIAANAYRALLNDIDTEGLVLDEGRAATGYERSVAATLSLAFEKLTPPARQLLCLCAFTAPEPLPERFIYEAVEVLPHELAEAIPNPLAWNKAVGELRRYGLLDRIKISTLDYSSDKDINLTEQALLFHRLTQQIAHARLAQPAMDCRYSLALLKKCCPTETNLPTHWPRYAALTSHVKHMDRYYTAGWLDTRSYCWLLDRMASYLKDGPALYSESAHWFQRALAINKQEVGEEDQQTLTTMSNLAEAIRAQGKLAEARELHEKTLSISQRVLGERHPDTLASMNNLAETLRAMSDFTSARTLHEQTLEINRQLWGLNHHQTLASINNLAETLRAQGNYAGAYTLHEQAVSISQQVLGKEHPDTLTTMSNFAESMRDMGNMEGAYNLLMETLALRRKTLGDDHPSTLTSMDNLASMLSEQNELARARSLQNKVLALKQRIFGEGHPETIITMNNLAGTLREQGDISSALSLLEKTFEISRKAQGNEHLSTLNVMSNLARTIAAHGDLGSARKIGEQTLEACLRTLGEEHPSTLNSMLGLANILAELGIMTDTQALEKEALEISARTLGEEHSITLTAMNNLARTLWRQGDLSGARTLLVRTLETRKRVLGEQHRNTLDTMTNLAGLIHEQGDVFDALKLQEQILDLSLHSLGEAHPDTLCSMNNLAGTLVTLGRLGEAHALKTKELDICKKSIGEEQLYTLNSTLGLAAICTAQGDLVSARSILETVLAIGTKVYGIKHPVIQKILSRLIYTLQKMGESEAAVSFIGQLEENKPRVD